MTNVNQSNEITSLVSFGGYVLFVTTVTRKFDCFCLLTIEVCLGEALHPDSIVVRLS